MWEQSSNDAHHRLINERCVVRLAQLKPAVCLVFRLVQLVPRIFLINVQLSSYAPISFFRVEVCLAKVLEKKSSRRQSCLTPICLLFIRVSFFFKQNQHGCTYENKNIHLKLLLHKLHFGIYQLSNDTIIKTFG